VAAVALYLKTEDGLSHQALLLGLQFLAVVFSFFSGYEVCSFLIKYVHSVLIMYIVS
jgi:hypothetical protein